jgi:hypothetical protein
VDQDQFYSELSKTSPDTFQQWKKPHDNILGCIEDFWTCVQHILCADAPEGLVPDEIEEEASLDTKEILSYSWRGVKEARYVSECYGDFLLTLAVFYSGL